MVDVSDKTRYKISEEEKIKRSMTLLVLTSLFLLSFSFLYLDIVNENLGISFVVAFLVAIIIQICNWIEGSKMISVSKRDLWVSQNWLKMFLFGIIIPTLFFIFIVLVFLIQSLF